MLTIGSLFSGIGGFELGLERAGLGRVVWQVESDERCRRVLAKHWPEVDRSVTDVRQAGAARLVRVDVLAGGFPCQDVSSAGAGAGLDGARSGLWWKFRRCVAELAPRVVVVENVASGARRWLCAVRGSLQELGYRTRALGVRASDVGAPHRRARVFVVAYADRGELRLQPGRQRGEDWPDEAFPRLSCRLGPLGGWPLDARRHYVGGVAYAADEQRRRTAKGGMSGGATQSGVGRGADGLPAGVERAPRRWSAAPAEAQHPWEPPRTATGVKDRPARLKALGNAVVPACAEVVGLAILHDLARFTAVPPAA